MTPEKLRVSLQIPTSEEERKNSVKGFEIYTIHNIKKLSTTKENTILIIPTFYSCPASPISNTITPRPIFSHLAFQQHVQHLILPKNVFIDPLSDFQR